MLVLEQRNGYVFHHINHFGDRIRNGARNGRL